MVEADIRDEKAVAPTNDRSKISLAKTCPVPKNSCKSKMNNKNSSDDECACKPTPMNAQEKKRVIEIQEKRKAEAAAAKKKADELRIKAEEAIEAANQARLAAVQKAVELSEKAQEATRKAE